MNKNIKIMISNTLLKVCPKLLLQVLIFFISATSVATGIDNTNKPKSTNLSIEDIKIKNPKVQFTAIGRPSLIKIKGENLKLQVSKLEKDKFEFRIFLDDFDTGIKLRNQHMKEKYLETNKYPYASLILSDISKLNLSDLNKTNKIKAELGLHGEKHLVEVEYKNTDAKTIESNFDINLTDFKISVPSYMGVTVADKIQVHVVFDLENKLN